MGEEYTMKRTIHNAFCLGVLISLIDIILCAGVL